MVEQWIVAGKQGGQKLCRRLSGVRPRTWSVCILALAVVLAAIHPLSTRLRKKPDLDAIANEVGSISYMFYRNGQTFSVRDAFGIHADTPRINHAGTKVLYCHTSENGGAAYISDLLTGERTMVYEEMASNFFNGPSTDLEVHQWSPDDTKFVYSRTGKNIVIHDITTSRDLATMQIPYTSDMAWLDSKSFACANRHAGQLVLVRQQKDGAWHQAGKPIAASHPGNPFPSFTALSPDTVAWVATNQIVSFNLNSHQTSVLAGVENHTLKAFTYQPGTKQFLLTCTGGKQDSLWRLDFAGQTNQQLIQLASAPSIRSAHLINGGKGFAYVNGNNHLVVQTNMQSDPLKLFTHGRADSFSVSADGEHLAVTAIASNEPAFGIWEYDVAANQTHPVIQAAERGLAHVHPVTHPFTVIHGPQNRNLYLVIYKPVPFDPHKKYPLVIANTPYHAAEPYMNQYGMAIANAGGYFAVLDRGSWFAKSGYGDAWADNEPYVIHYLARDPTIDRKRIFLVSNCVESNFLRDYAAKFPGTVTGAIMLIANGLPNPNDFASGQYASRLLISTCDAWEGKGEHMRKYQETAARSGVEMDYVIHPNTKHDFVSKQSQRARIRAMLHFVFDH